MQSVSIIIPVYNEEATIARLLENLLSITWPIKTEVIVVNDGSNDNTKSALSAFENRCILKTLPENRGKGYAMRQGVSLAAGEWVAFLDADLENDPRDFFTLIEKATQTGADSVIGSRLLAHSRAQGTSPFFFWGGKLLTLYMNILFSLSLTDVTSGFRIVRRTSFNELPLSSERFSIEAELVARQALLGQKIVEAPISYKPRSVTEGKKLQLTDGVRAALFVLSIRLSHLLR
ncbi:glycosyltransferase family 2 protein [Acetobacteraceae bacterium]|nr:glycosyltransferase family 2 protein [Candidatus Parcubacteria bacterium]